MTKEQVKRNLDIIYNYYVSQALITKNKYPKEIIAGYLLMDTSNTCLYVSKALKQEPCDYYINRQAVLDLMQLKMSGKELYKSVYDLPPVILKKKIGHWIKVDKDKCKCDQCEVIFFIAMYPNGNINYCPNCGAKMIEPQKNEKINCKYIKCKNCINHDYCDYEPYPLNDEENIKSIGR